MRLFLIIFLMSLFIMPIHVYGQNPFMSKESTQPARQESRESISAEKPQSKQRFSLLDITPVRMVTSFMARIQVSVRQDIEKLMTREKNSSLPVSIILLSFFSFLYGLIHAAGPGHGKVFIGSYMIAGKSRFIDTFKAAVTIVTAHTLSAITIIVVLFIVFKSVSIKNSAAAEGYLRISSATLICLVGLILLIKNIIGAANKRKSNETQLPVNSGQDKSLLALALSVGIIPCPGVTLIILFAINLGMIPAGIISVVSMALGMIVTITLIGILFLVAGKSALYAVQTNNAKHYFILHTLNIVGALLIFLFGLILLTAFL